MANKHIKSLFNMAAFSAIQADSELKAYYQRRIEAGKSKMSTINIVRNKLIHRVFAVIKRGTPYVNLNRYAIWKNFEKKLGITLEYADVFVRAFQSLLSQQI